MNDENNGGNDRSAVGEHSLVDGSRTSETKTGENQHHLPGKSSDKDRKLSRSISSLSDEVKTMCGFTIDDQVTLTFANADVPKGTKGVVVGFKHIDEPRIKVKFPLGTWNFKPTKLIKVLECSIDGKWDRGTICGTSLVWSSGAKADLELISRTEIKMTFNGGAAYTAVLKEDAMLHWCDGDVWQKADPEPLCPAGHALEAFATPDAGWSCDTCSNKFPLGTQLHGCKECSYDKCEECLSKADYTRVAKEAASDEPCADKIVNSSADASTSEALVSVSRAVDSARKWWAKADCTHVAKGAASDEPCADSSADVSTSEALVSVSDDQNVAGDDHSDNTSKVSTKSAHCLGGNAVVDAPANVTTEAALDTKVRRGVIVRLHGLESQAHLNGMLGLVLYPGKDDRWAVHLDSEESGAFRNVRGQNLEFVCCGGAAQPLDTHQNLPTEEASAGLSLFQQGGPIAAGKRKHECLDAADSLQSSLAEQFAELEREQLAHEKQNSLKRRRLSKGRQEWSLKEGADGLIEDLVEVPQDDILKRLMAASTEDLAKVVTPETTAYVVLARSFRTMSSGG